jgi:hypothetical protein
MQSHTGTFPRKRPRIDGNLSPLRTFGVTVQWPRARQGLTRALLFVGITWALTAGFELLFQAYGFVLTAAERGGLVDLLGPKSGGRTITVCTPPADLTPAPAARRDVAAFAAWRLGTRFGFVSSARDAETPAVTAVAAEQGAVGELAKALGVPKPAFGPLGPASRRMTAFTDAIDRDEACIVGSLARLYSPRHGDLFRFGAFSGYAQYIHGAFPRETPLFAEIRYFGQQAGVDEALWHPLISDLGDISLEEAQGTLQAAIEAVSRQLTPGPQHTGGPR